MSFAVNASPDITNDITYYLKTKSLNRNTTDIGDLKWSVINTDRYGWLICDGRSLSRKKYKDLFAVIGTSFGSVDDESFNLPDCRSRVLGAIGQGDGLSDRTLGETVGTETHTLTIPEMPSHDHSGNTGDYTHNHSGNTGDDTHDHGGRTGETGSAPESEQVLTDVVAVIESTALVAGSSVHTHEIESNTHNHSIENDTHNHTIPSQGDDQPHNNMQPTIFIGNVLIFSGVRHVL